MRALIALLIGVVLGVAGLFGVLSSRDVRLGKIYFGSWTSDFETNPGVIDLAPGTSETPGETKKEEPVPRPPADVPKADRGGDAR